MCETPPATGLQPALRNLHTQTTIPFGCVDEADVDNALSEKYSQPLWQCLFADSTVSEVEVESLVHPTACWADFRIAKGDMIPVEPEMVEPLNRMKDLKQKATDAAVALSKQSAEHESLLAKIEFAADAMLKQQFARVKEMGCTTPHESPLFKTNKKNIEVWEKEKKDVCEKTLRVAKDDVKTTELNVVEHLRTMVEIAYSCWLAKLKDDPMLAAEPDLLKELESVIQSSPGPASPGDSSLFDDLASRMEVRNGL